MKYKQIYSFTLKDGTAVFGYDYGSSPRYVKRYNLSTAWDLTRLLQLLHHHNG